MSKSLGNVILMKDVISTFGGISFRLMLLSSHYRAPASFSDDTIREAQVKLSQLQDTAKKASIALQLQGVEPERLKPQDESKFLDAICDDLGTPNALAVLYEENKNLNNLLRNKQTPLAELEESYARIRAYEYVLGIVLAIPTLNEDDKKLFGSYYQAKEKKDFAESDLLRNKLIQKGLF
jgi:cysteinyl-tRNA synthetase